MFWINLLAASSYVAAIERRRSADSGKNGSGLVRAIRTPVDYSWRCAVK
jgi:hypothetical protein